VPAHGESRGEHAIVDPGDQSIVNRASWHFGYDPSFEELNVIVFAQDAGLDHLVILVDREPADGQRRNNGG
jgi:hypothetical protein